MDARNGNEHQTGLPQERMAPRIRWKKSEVSKYFSVYIEGRAEVLGWFPTKRHMYLFAGDYTAWWLDGEDPGARPASNHPRYQG